MKRRAKVELFEEIRREYEFGKGRYEGGAEAGSASAEVRQALADAQPPARSSPSGAGR